MEGSIPFPFAMRCPALSWTLQLHIRDPVSGADISYPAPRRVSVTFQPRVSGHPGQHTVCKYRALHSRSFWQYQERREIEKRERGREEGEGERRGREKREERRERQSGRQGGREGGRWGERERERRRESTAPFAHHSVY
eukprot:1741948-Rhodomonas_salina.3